MYGLSTACIAIQAYSHLDLFLETRSISVRFKKNDLNTPIKYRMHVYNVHALLFNRFEK